MVNEAEVTELDFETAVLNSSVVIKWFREGEALLLQQSYLEGKLRLTVPDLLSMKLERVAVTPELLGQAVKLAHEHGVTVCNAAFLACAEQRGALLVTADEKLAQALKESARVRFLGEISASEV
jgi:hypothetical protein